MNDHERLIAQLDQDDPQWWRPFIFPDDIADLAIGPDYKRNQVIRNAKDRGVLFAYNMIRAALVVGIVKDGG